MPVSTDDAEDITIALLDSWATACDVLSFYTERLAQESYLGTAAERTSLAELGKLIAYRMDPGVAATTLLAFTLERPPAVAVPSTDPGMAVPPLPGVLTLPAGLRVQSVPGPGQLPQTFETIEPIVGRPEWNSLPVVATAVAPLTRGTKSVFVGAADTRLAAGDAVLLAGVTPATTNLTGDRWDLRTVVEIEQVRVDCLRLELDRALGSTHPRNPPADDAAAARGGQMSKEERRQLRRGHLATRSHSRAPSRALRKRLPGIGRA